MDLQQNPEQKKERRNMEKEFNIGQLYIVDFVKKLAHKKNIWAIMYLVLNVVIVTLIIKMFEPNWWLAILYGILTYIVTGFVALSPVGEWLFRLVNGCKKIEDPALLNRLQPLFLEVKARAQEKRPDVIVDPKIALYMKEDNDLNAFAMGRRTVCVTRGLLQLSDEEIKGVLGHEFGHLVTHDTDLTLLITVGNFMISAAVTAFRLLMLFYNVIVNIVSAFFGNEGALARILYSFSSFVITLFVDGAMWVWTQLGILMVMKSSRDAEFEADAFSCDIGYSEGLLSFFRMLDRLEERSGAKKERGNIFAALAASHPDTDKRIAKIESNALKYLEY